MKDQETLNKHCALCGVPFHCGSDENGCWCSALPPLTPIPGRGCLCRNCLEEELKESSRQAR